MHAAISATIEVGREQRGDLCPVTGLPPLQRVAEGEVRLPPTSVCQTLVGDGSVEVVTKPERSPPRCSRKSPSDVQRSGCRQFRAVERFCDQRGVDRPHLPLPLRGEARDRHPQACRSWSSPGLERIGKCFIVGVAALERHQFEQVQRMTTTPLGDVDRSAARWPISLRSAHSPSWRRPRVHVAPRRTSSGCTSMDLVISVPWIRSPDRVPRDGRGASARDDLRLAARSAGPSRPSTHCRRDGHPPQSVLPPRRARRRWH